MLAISSHYSVAMKDTVFTAKDFRPFGTTHLPGLAAIYLYLTTGFLFLGRKLNVKYILLLIILITASFFTIFVCQVRSALLKYVLELVFIGFGLLITSETTMFQRLSLMIKVLMGLILIAFVFAFYSKDRYLSQIEAAQYRWEKIDTFQDFKSRRAGPRMALKIARMRLSEFPIGIGPGLTGAASSVSRSQIDSDPIYDQDTFWGYDNLFLSLIVEFGYGAFFYIAFVFSVPILILARFIQSMRNKHLFEARVRWIALTQITVILFGNWGAIGLPYNPESFFFWFWAALALNIKEQTKKDMGYVSP